MKCHNGPYIASCADKLGRELTKDELIHALDCLAHEALQTVEKYQVALKKISGQRANRYESTVGIVCNIADAALDSENSHRLAAASGQ
jgi:hypothetical protein